MANEMRVKVKKQFLSPLTNRMAKVDEEMNVPQSRFWFRRLQEGDCQKIGKSKPKSKPKVKAPSLPQKSKGSN